MNKNNKDEKVFKTLVEGAYSNVLLFNKRRVGELQRITLHTHEEYINRNAECDDFEKLLTPSEKILVKRLKRVVIKGKRGRGVPVLFDEVAKKLLI